MTKAEEELVTASVVAGIKALATSLRERSRESAHMDEARSNGAVLSNVTRIIDAGEDRVEFQGKGMEYYHYDARKIRRNAKAATASAS
jgi:hypothetical protein